MFQKISNWKAPEPDGVLNFWFENIIIMHGYIQPWNTKMDNKEEAILIQKGKEKGRKLSNKRAFTCLPLLRKLLTGLW